MIRRCLRLRSGFLIVFLALAGSAFAQGGRADLNGTIFDSGKMVVPGVTITAVNEATGLERTAVTGPEGDRKSVV